MAEDHSSFACVSNKCGRFFNALSDLEEHRIKDHKIPKCPICKKLAESQDLNMHILRMHKDIKNITCDECGKEFDNKYLFKNHYKCKHEVTELCTCDYCGAV